MSAAPNLNVQDFDVSDAIHLLVERYNVESVEFDRLAEYNDQLLAENAAQAEHIKELEAKVTLLDELNERNMSAVSKFKPIAEAAVALRHTHDMTKANLVATQKELTSLKGGDSPARLREQIKRNKEKNVELTTRNERLLREAKELRSQIKACNNTIDGLKKELYVSSVKSANGAFTRLWSDGVQNIVLWPDSIKMQNTQTGEVSSGRALLYMHQTGRGALLTLDETTGTTQMGESPKGGMRLTKAAKEFTDAWLYKVNATQNGDVTDSDLRVTDI